MNYRFICFGKNIENVKIALVHKTIGSKSSKFVDQIAAGDKVFFYVNSSIVCTATVDGLGYYSDQVVWSDKLYPYRFKLKNITIHKPAYNFLTTTFKDRLYSEFGRGWGYQFLYSPKALPPILGRELETDLLKSNGSNGMPIESSSVL